MNDSLISSSIRRGRMRSRWMGAVMKGAVSGEPSYRNRKRRYLCGFTCPAGSKKGVGRPPEKYPARPHKATRFLLDKRLFHNDLFAGNGRAWRIDLRRTRRRVRGIGIVVILGVGVAPAVRVRFGVR